MPCIQDSSVWLIYFSLSQQGKLNLAYRSLVFCSSTYPLSFWNTWIHIQILSFPQKPPQALLAAVLPQAFPPTLTIQGSLL